MLIFQGVLGVHNDRKLHEKIGPLKIDIKNVPYGDGFGFQTNFLGLFQVIMANPDIWRNDLQTDLQDVSFQITHILKGKFLPQNDIKPGCH